LFEKYKTVRYLQGENREPDDFGSKIKQKKGIKRKIERTVAGDDDGEESIKISC
jgi:hypothetical protein